MKKTLVCLFLCFSLLSAGTSVFAAGTAEDPLISQSYIDGFFKPSVLSKAREDIKNAVASRFGSSAEAGLPGGMQSLEAKAGGKLSLGLGQSIIIISGEARVTVSAGTVVNASVGAAAVSGRLNTGQRYIVCEDSAAVVDFSKDSRVFVSASAVYSAPAPESKLPFTDVPVGIWYYSDLVSAYEQGLVNGMTLTTYEPQSPLSIAQCIKLASCMHELYHTGSVTLENSPPGELWFGSYVAYALEKGIISDTFEDYNAPVSRSTFVDIIYNALPAECYTAINDVPDGSIGDLPAEGDWSKVYAFYRAGILTGYTAADGYNEHDFGPESTLTRAELATIMNRMLEPEARKSFSMN